MLLPSAGFGSMEWNREGEEMLLIQAISNLEWKEMLSTLESSLWVPGLILGLFNPLHQTHMIWQECSAVGRAALWVAPLFSELPYTSRVFYWWERLSSWRIWERQLRSVSSAWLCDRRRFLVSRNGFLGLLKLLQYLSVDTLALLVRVLHSCLALHLKNAIALVVLHSVCNIANL